MSVELPPVAPLSLLVVQGTRFCNIDCKYCYLPNRNRRDMMSDEVFDRLIARVAEHPHVACKLPVVWHAGEPLAVGIDYYKRLLPKLRTLTNTRVDPIIQTNGTLLNDEWCQLLKEYDVALGISIDGPKHLHDVNRVTRAKRGTHDQIMRNIDLLRRHNIKWTALTVVTRRTLDHLPELFSFYDEHSIRRVGLLIEEIEGENKSSDILSVPDDKLREAWRDIIRLSAHHQISVREVETMIPRLLGEPFDNSQTRPGTIITVAVNGDFSTYSPELLEQHTETYGSFVIGNVMQQSFIEAFAGAHNQLLLTDITAGVAKCQASCDYFAICKGACPSNKHGEHGTFDAAETTHCRRFVQMQAEAVLSELEGAVPHLPIMT